MPFANPSVTDIIATTIQSRSRVIADNVTKNNALLAHLEKRGNVKPISGGNVILQELRNCPSPRTRTPVGTRGTRPCQ